MSSGVFGNDQSVVLRNARYTFTCRPNIDSRSGSYRLMDPLIHVFTPDRRMMSERGKTSDSS